MERKELLEIRRTIQAANHYNKKTGEMLEEWKAFKSTSNKRWNLISGIILTILIFTLGYNYTTYGESKTHVTKDELQYDYITKNDFFIHSQLEMAKIQQLLAMDRAGADSMQIVDAFENWKWIVSIVFQTDKSRGAFDTEVDYSDYFNKYESK